MNIHSAINKDVFAPHDERMLVAVEVKRRKKKKVPFLTTGGSEPYLTFICLSVSNKKPPQLFITKVKQYDRSPSFTRRSQWTVEQLRQVNGINPDQDCPEFDLVFDNAYDKWVASTAAEKCMFVQIVYHACQTYWEGQAGGGPGDRQGHGAQSDSKGSGGQRRTEFVNCQSKLTGDACSVNLVIYRCKVFLNRVKNAMVPPPSHPKSGGSSPQLSPNGGAGQACHRAGLALSGPAEGQPRTADLKHSAQQASEATRTPAAKGKK